MGKAEERHVLSLLYSPFPRKYPIEIHPGAPHLVILANVTTMDREALPVAL